MPTTVILSAEPTLNSNSCDQQQLERIETPACTAMLPERLAVGSHLPPCLKLERRLNCYCPNVSTILGSPHPSQGQRAYTAQAQCNRQLVYDKNAYNVTRLTTLPELVLVSAFEDLPCTRSEADHGLLWPTKESREYRSE